MILCCFLQNGVLQLGFVWKHFWTVSTSTKSCYQIPLRNSPCALSRHWVLILVVFSSVGLKFYSLSWWLFPPAYAVVFLVLVSFRVSFIIIGRNIFQSLPKMTSRLLMSVVIAILIIWLQVTITNDVHCLREGSGLTQEPIKPRFSGYKLSSLIFSKPIANGMF